MEGGNRAAHQENSGGSRPGVRYQIIVAAVAALIFLGCILSPPSLMDDVDAVQAQIARNMLQSGDWVTARLDGIPYLEKSPLKYWMIAVSFKVFGPHDWAARIPLALATVLLCWVAALFGAWAFGGRAGMYTGLVLATSVGLFLFTRILIPDACLTLAITLALWGLLRALEEEEPHPTLWALAMWAAMAVGLLLKGLIAAVFPVAAAFLYLAFTRQLFLRRTWVRLKPFSGLLLFLLIAAPWLVLATLRNPPYFDFTMHSERGSYHGFFWFYFINEHVLRFLNMRYPRDYNTVPRLYFWLFHLLWFFPWSLYFPAIFVPGGARTRACRVGTRAGAGRFWSRLRSLADQAIQPPSALRAAHTRLLCFCWAGFILVFFSFSTTQEYYSMPCYPALALLLGPAIASGHRWLRWGTRAAAMVAALAAAIIAAILWMVRSLEAPGDIASALNQNPDLYTLSLGHMTDLTLHAFAYLRLPLAVAGAAFLIGAIGAWRGARRNLVPVASLTIMMVIFFHAARLALVVFDPYMASRPLAQALLDAPPGKLIVDDQYYTFSSVFFYTNRSALLLNGRVNNLVYGSFAPSAPQDVFIDDADFARLWASPGRYYLVVEGPQVPRIEKLSGNKLVTVKASGGKFLFSNR